MEQHAAPGVEYAPTVNDSLAPLLLAFGAGAPRSGPIMRPTRASMLFLRDGVVLDLDLVACTREQWPCRPESGDADWQAVEVDGLVLAARLLG